MNNKTHLILNCSKACFLSTFFIFLYSANCSPKCAENIKTRSYLDLNDEIVNLYFKPPYQTKKAIEMLDMACRCNAQKTDMACYNSGVLYEIRGEKKKALIAYKKALKIFNQPVYKLAIQNLENKKPAPDEFIPGLVHACKNDDSKYAISILKKASKSDFRPVKQIIMQPWFIECMAKEPEFAALVEKFPDAKMNQKEFTSHYYSQMAQLHPLNSIFDIELYLTKRLKQNISTRRITKNWQLLARSAKSGNASQSIKYLNKLHIELNNVSNPNSPLIRNFRRAIYVLVTKDPGFGKIRSNPGIRRLLVYFKN